MVRSSPVLPSLGVLVAALAPAAAHAQATLSRAGHAPVTVRTAITVDGTRTTTWTQVHAEAEAGAFALVVPAGDGAAIDLATDAWMEALEDATAPRVAPPTGVEAACPGEEPPLHVAGDLEHHVPLVPAEVDVLEGAAELLLWAAERQLEVPAPVASAFADAEATHWVALRFAAPAGDVWTPTVRVTLASAEPLLPLALVAASDVEIGATIFALGAGRAAVDGAEVTLDPAALELDAASGSSDYAELRSAALAPPGAWLVESASHASLVAPTPLPGGEAVPPLVDAYFTRAAEQGATTDDPEACASLAGAAIDDGGAIAPACPRGDLAIVGAQASCEEAPAAGETDPEQLRCGPDADDLALALSGLRGDEAWLTRIALRIAPGESGVDRAVTAAGGDPVEPLLVAGGVDLSGCGEGGSGGGGEGGASGAGSTGGPGSGPGSSGPGGPGSGGPAAGSGGSRAIDVDVPVRVYDVGCGCSGEYVIVDYLSVPEDEVPEDGSYYAEDGDDCGGDSAESYETSELGESPPDDEDCGGDTTESADTAEDEDCGGDTSESADTSGDDCGGDTSDTSSGDDGSGDDGSGDDGGDGSGSDGDDGSDGSSADSGCGCDESSVAAATSRAAKRPRVKRALRSRPRLSVMTLGLLALVAPLRRLTRPRRRGPDPREPG